MEKSKATFIAGVNTMLGEALRRKLIQAGVNLVGLGEEHPDLREHESVDNFFKRHRPDSVFLVGGMTGGIVANQTFPADLMTDNLAVELNVINAAHKYGSQKLLYLASSCCYPKHCPQPMKEEYLLNGPLEPTNEPYAVAKIAGLKLVQAFNAQYGTNFISAIPANNFGPGDDFSPENSHVVGALIRRIHSAVKLGEKRVVVWGSGRPRREFIYVDDLADGCIFLMKNYSNNAPINLGSGISLSIAELAEAIKKTCGFEGDLIFDASKPDGMPEKVLDISGLTKLGWASSYSLEDGLEQTYKWYCKVAP